MSRIVASAALTALVLAVLVGPAHAHKVSLFAWVEKGTVYTESKFSGGRTPKGSTVIVSDLSGNQLLKGVTDAEGRFSFPAPAVPGIEITLGAGQGHLAQWTVSAEELADVDAAALPPPETAAATVANRHMEPTATPDTDALTIEAIRSAVGDPLAKEVQALRAEMRRLRQEIGAEPSLTDILGGIGYIIGLVGIGAYFKNRRNRHD